MLSSEIEGIHTTLNDVYTQALDGSMINKNTQLVLNYVEALKIAVKMIKEEDLPIVTRVILEAHRVLMSTGEGERACPGQFRKQSVKVGELVPPPAPEIPDLIRSLEKFMKAGLMHVQFETIHPFADGNGRIGRLLIVLMLIKDNRLSAPIIYPSLYFKKHHLQYYQHLDRVRTQGDFCRGFCQEIPGIHLSRAMLSFSDCFKIHCEAFIMVQDNIKLSNMPDEIIINIFKELDIKSAFSLAQTSKQFYEIFRTSKDLWPHYPQRLLPVINYFISLAWSGLIDSKKSFDLNLIKSRINASKNASPDDRKVLYENSISYIIAEGGGVPLINAIKEDPKIAFNLIELGVNLDIPDSTGKTPLIWAVIKRNYKAAEALILAGANIHATDSTSKNALMYAQTVSTNQTFMPTLIDLIQKAMNTHTGSNTTSVFLTNYASQHRNPDGSWIHAKYNNNM